MEIVTKIAIISYTVNLHCLNKLSLSKTNLIQDEIKYVYIYIYIYIYTWAANMSGRIVSDIYYIINNSRRKDKGNQWYDGGCISDTQFCWFT